MSWEWIEQQYKLKLRRGQIVLVRELGSSTPGQLGIATKADHHVWVRLNGEKRAHPYHPADVVPAEEGNVPV